MGFVCTKERSSFVKSGIPLDIEMKKEGQVWKTEKEKVINPDILEYLSSEDIQYDAQLIKYDILVNKAHAKMLKKVGLLSEKEGKQILGALENLEKDWKSGNFELKKELEDVHMNIEAYLTQKLGETGKKIHTARSRNDQVMADLNLYMKEKLQELISETSKLHKKFKELSKKYSNLKMPAYTHMQQAQAITFGYWFDCYAALIGKDLESFNFLLQKIDVSPLGAGAVAGTSLPIDKNFTAKELGFSKVFENALATISSRGENETEILFAIVMLMEHLGKMAADLQLYSTQEFGMIKLGDAISTGSSMLPQKKNPDVFEMVRAKGAEIIGMLVENLILLKGLPSGYNRDYQLTKKNIIKGFEIALKTVSIMGIAVENIIPVQERMEELAKQSNAIEEVNKLVMQGVPFREAYKKVRENLINNSK